MQNIFQEKYLIWIVAVLVGVLMISPSFYFHYFDPAYRGIELFGSDAESDYLAQIQEVYDFLCKTASSKSIFIFNEGERTFSNPSYDNPIKESLYDSL